MELFSRKFLETVTIPNFCRNQHLPENCKFICVSVSSTFLVIIAKERFLSTFFCVESLFSKCWFWSLWLSEWIQLFSLNEKRVFPKNDVTMTSQVGVTYFKSCVAVLRIRGCLHWLNLFAGYGRSYHDRGFRGPERFVVVKSFYIIG